MREAVWPVALNKLHLRFDTAAFSTGCRCEVVRMPLVGCLTRYEFVSCAIHRQEAEHDHWVPLLPGL
jgi:hypothetical protein